MMFSVKPAVCCCVYLNSPEQIIPARAQLGALVQLVSSRPCTRIYVSGSNKKVLSSILFIFSLYLQRYLCFLAHKFPTHILFVFLFLFCFSSSCVPYVASFSGLSILIAPSGFSNCYLRIFSTQYIVDDVKNVTHRADERVHGDV